MRICILSREYPPHGLGWGSSWLYEKLAQEYFRLGHQVHVICQAYVGATQRRDNGVVVHEVGTDPARGSAMARLNWSFHAWRKLQQLITGLGIDVVDAPLMWAEGLIHGLRKRNVPVLLLAHGWADMLLETSSYVTVVERVQLHVASSLESFAAQKADRVIANSHFTAYKLAERLHVRREKIAIIYEHIEIEKFGMAKPKQAREQLGVGDQPLLLYAGFLQARKGIQILSDAMPMVVRHVPSARLVMIGRDTDTAPTGGSFKAYLQATAKEHGWQENLVLPGFVPDDVRSELFAACDLFVFPSLYEPFGKPTLEAMACNRPVIATATGIAAEIGDVSPAIRIVPPGDPQALAEAIIEVLSLPKEQREQLASGHRDIVEERFSFKRVVEETLAVYEEALAERKS
jgi:glycogen(starch) synthase